LECAESWKTPVAERQAGDLRGLTEANAHEARLL